MVTTRGVLFVHSSPAALCPHIEWAAAGALGVPVRLDWIPQPAERGSLRTELPWTGAPGTATRIASELRRWQRLRFEITEEPSPGVDGQRYSFTPELGLFSAMTSVHGDILIPEERLKRAVVDEALGLCPLLEGVDRLLGRPWDDELEVFRYAGDGAPVRWLHQVV